MRNVANAEDFTNRLKSISDGEPEHIQDYVLKVVRKFFLKNWERATPVKEAVGLPTFYGFKSKRGVDLSRVPILLQTSQGSEIRYISASDPAYEMAKRGETVYLDLRHIAELQDKIQSTLEYLRVAYEQPRDLTTIAWVDAVKKGEDWHKAEQKKRELTAKEERMRLYASALSGTIPILEMVYKEETWTIYSLTTQDALQYEGDKMHNCVASYWYQVRDNESFIFSLRKELMEPRITIELAPRTSGLRLNQCRGLANVSPSNVDLVLTLSMCNVLGVDWMQMFPHMAALESELRYVDVRKLKQNSNDKPSETGDTNTKN